MEILLTSTETVFLQVVLEEALRDQMKSDSDIAEIRKQIHGKPVEAWSPLTEKYVSILNKTKDGLGTKVFNEEVSKLKG